MSIQLISEGDKVKCIASDWCGRMNCDHHGVHRAETSGFPHQSCRNPSWCPEVEGWVCDKLAWDWIEDEECECDPNVAFRRKKG